jgi:hypothetical protein
MVVVEWACASVFALVEAAALVGGPWAALVESAALVDSSWVPHVVGMLVGVEFPCVGVLVGKQHQHQQEVVHGRWQLHLLFGAVHGRWQCAWGGRLFQQGPPPWVVDLPGGSLQVSPRAARFLADAPGLALCELGGGGGTSLPSGGLETAIPIRLGVLSNLVWWECAQFIISIYVYIYI